KSLPPGGSWHGAAVTEGACGRNTDLTSKVGASPQLSYLSRHFKAKPVKPPRLSAAMNKYQPFSKPVAYRPLAPSVASGDSSLPEGALDAPLLLLHRKKALH